MTIKGLNIYNTLIVKSLSILPNINKRREDFILEIFLLLLSIKGRINFLQFARYGKYSEQRYRQQFEKQFNFLEFNKQLTVSSGSGNYAIAIDPSYISKSGKCTPGLGYFWSGCAKKAKWGLEITGLATIDIDNNTAFHLEAVQTITDKKDNFSLTDWYADIIHSRKDALLGLSNIVVADAWFSKNKFVDKIISTDMELVCRFRDDADLSYLFKGERTGGQGRPKKYDGKVIHTDVDLNHFSLIEDNNQETIYSAQVYSKSLKQTVKLVHVAYKRENKKVIRKLYYCTDLNKEALDVLRIYRSRFQIEFLYRDAKQHIGLNDCQARSENKLNFHFNSSLTAINIAKIQHWISIPKKQRSSFSMSDIKTMNNNRLQLNRFFSVFGINPHSTKNIAKTNQIIQYGTIAA